MSSPSLFPVPPASSARLRARLEQPEALIAPGCFDGLSARVLEAAGHESLFVSGFAVAAARLGLPDVGLMGYAESLDQMRSVRDVSSLAIIADADTGYGNAVNAARTFLGFSRAGAQCVMIEDQRWPKQCGHTAGKQVVDRAEAIARVRAAAESRDAHNLDTMIMARTDAAATDGIDEAMWRVEAFVEAGADITFLEAPRTESDMARYCRETPGHKTANLVDDGKTPWLSPNDLSEMGYSVVLYPVSMLLAATDAMASRAALLRTGSDDPAARASFDDVRSAVAWPGHDDLSNRHANPTH